LRAWHALFPPQVFPNWMLKGPPRLLANVEILQRPYPWMWLPMRILEGVSFPFLFSGPLIILFSCSSDNLRLASSPTPPRFHAPPVPFIIRPVGPNSSTVSQQFKDPRGFSPTDPGGRRLSSSVLLSPMRAFAPFVLFRAAYLFGLAFVSTFSACFIVLGSAFFAESVS